MSDSDGIPAFQCSHPDGKPRTRIEMDQWIRKEVPKVHWLRIHASRTLGLPKQISWDMREIVLRHWILDEMLRRQLITGDSLGVNATVSNDEGELRQFTQRLAALIQTGHAIQPTNGEGIDMNGYTPPPPPVMGGAPAQQTAYPPGPPAPPGVPMAPPGYQAGPPQYAGPPQGPPQYQAGPPQPPQGPPPGVPMAPPPMGPPGAPPAGPPQAAAPGPGRRAKRADAPAQAAPPAAPVPPMGAPPGPPAPQGFAPAGYAAPAAPAGFAPPAPAYQQAPQPAAPVQQQVAPTVDLSVVLQKLDQLAAAVAQLTTNNAALSKKVEMLSMINTILGRGMYQKQGTADAAGFLTELGIPLPQ
jgi:hypothetical protein